jgi:hypothetical protein
MHIYAPTEDKRTAPLRGRDEVASKQEGSQKSCIGADQFPLAYGSGRDREGWQGTQGLREGWQGTEGLRD